MTYDDGWRPVPDRLTDAHAVYVSEDRCVLVWVDEREDGPPELSVATRDDPADVWSPPIRVKREGS